LPRHRDKLTDILKFLKGLGFRRILNANGSRLMLKGQWSVAWLYRRVRLLRG